jgi:hypothetical protein
MEQAGFISELDKWKDTASGIYFERRSLRAAVSPPDV